MWLQYSLTVPSVLEQMATLSQNISTMQCIVSSQVKHHVHTISHMGRKQIHLHSIYYYIVIVIDEALLDQNILPTVLGIMVAHIQFKSTRYVPFYKFNKIIVVSNSAER